MEYQELFDYTHEMNQRLIRLCTGHPDKMTERAVKLLSHILNAHRVWNNRIDRQEEDFGVWQVHSLAHLADIDLTNYKRTSDLLKADPEKEIAYVNSQGKAFINKTKDILFHLVNHATYHRAQIATELKNAGLEPLITDYIAYKR